MGFWDTFLKVWQVRTSIQIQEDFERGYRESIEHNNTLRNIPDIIDELDNKNEAWDEILEKQRKKSIS
jgi:hypothetical protein